MKRVPAQLFLLLPLFLSVVASGPSQADTQPDARVALHVVSALQCDLNPAGRCGACRPDNQGIPCSDYNLQWPLFSGARVYLVVAQADPTAGVAGLSCGIDYSAPYGDVDVFGWTLCADLEFANSGPNGTWPQAGSGNRITWDFLDNCQRGLVGADGVHAVAGCFYVYAYAPGMLQVTTNNNLVTPPELAVADCSQQVCATYLPPERAGSVSFGDTFAPGCNPCLAPCATAVPVERHTWGRLKQGFAN